MKPDMGLFIISSRLSNKCFIESTADLKGAINGTKFKLEAGSHPNRELQKDWKKFGAANFDIKILEYLKYDKDESKTDYTEELSLLKMIWEENLLKQDMEFYCK